MKRLYTDGKILTIEDGPAAGWRTEKLENIPTGYMEETDFISRIRQIPAPAQKSFCTHTSGRRHSICPMESRPTKTNDGCGTADGMAKSSWRALALRPAANNRPVMIHAQMLSTDQLSNFEWERAAKISHCAPRSHPKHGLSIF